LRGQALQDALDWAAGKILRSQDYQYRNKEAAEIDSLLRGHMGDPAVPSPTPQIAVLNFRLQDAQERLRQTEQERDTTIKRLVSKKQADLESLPQQFPITPDLEKLLVAKGKFEPQIKKDLQEFERHRAKWVAEETPKSQAYWSEKVKTTGWAYHTKIEQIKTEIDQWEMHIAAAEKKWL
jgi:exonuclease VII large subunit